MRRRAMRAACRVALAAAAVLPAGAAGAAVIDDMADTAAWQAVASDQVRAGIVRDGDGSLCLQADFGGVSGYAVMRRELPIEWPAAYELVLRWKGGGARNDVQVKWADASGDNVWWISRPDAVLPQRLAPQRFRERHVGFAWGPAADRTLRSTRSIEFALVAGREGGRSRLCVARIELQPRAPDPAAWPEPLVQAGAGTLQLDYGLLREFNGVALRWPAGRVDYDLLASDDGRRWRTLRRVRGSPGGQQALYLPETEARHLRVRRLRAGPLPAVELRTAASWPDRNAVMAARAAASPRGSVPRAFLGEQPYWTLVGVDGGGARSGLLGEDGAIEVGRGGFSVEPALRLRDGRWVTWADVQATQSLADGGLPLPAVHWRHEALQLGIEAAADGPAHAPSLLARYTLHNRGPRRLRGTLVLAVRPWQVNPPQQFLNTPGGVRALGRLRLQAGTLWVDGRPLTATPRATRASALREDGGVGLEALVQAAALVRLHDPLQGASAALQWDVDLAPGQRFVTGWVVPLGAPDRQPAPDLDARLAAAQAAWQRRLARVAVDAGPDARPIADTLRSTLAQMLVSREGPALRPGTRSYARTWIRDGAMMAAGLLRMGEHAVARAFVDDYAPRIFESGKVPCCFDARGADPTPEHDSHGQYLYAVAEVWRHTRDDRWLARHGPVVQRVVDHLEGLRRLHRQPGVAPHLHGLLPPSISHEGYADKPAYSYWDGFWALRGYKDAVRIAQALGWTSQAAQWAEWRDEFERELRESIVLVAPRAGGVIAGAADRGDFDPTSTTVAIDPAQAALPRELVLATFERYWQEALARAEGRRDWTDYTPYELRTVGALLRLRQPERAHALLDFFFRDQRPAGWNQWAEVVVRDPRQPRFLGDMPHAWVASDYLRSALDLHAYDTDEGLVIGAGWKAAWLDHGVQVRNLSTAWGRLDYAVRREGTGWRLDLQSPLRGPATLAWALPGPLPAATHEGRALAWNDETRELRLPPAPATILLAPAR